MPEPSRPENAPPSRAPAVDRAMAILRLVAASPVPLGVSEIARGIGVGKSTVHGILQALRAQGALEQDRAKKFQLGPLLEELARRRSIRRSLAEVCRPHLGHVVDRSGQTAILGVPEGERLRIESVQEGGGAVRLAATPGMRIPLLAGAAGKVALAWGATELPPVLPRFTDRSPTDPSALAAEVEAVRRDGVAFDRGEYLQGVAAVAAPVRVGGRLVGILYAVGFWDELGDAGLRELAAPVREAAAAAGADLEEGRAAS